MCVLLSMLGPLRTWVTASPPLETVLAPLTSLPEAAFQGYSPLQWISRSCMSLFRIGYPQKSFLSPVHFAAMLACWGLGICYVVFVVQNQREIPRSEVLIKKRDDILVGELLYCLPQYLWLCGSLCGVSHTVNHIARSSSLRQSHRTQFFSPPGSRMQSVRSSPARTQGSRACTSASCAH